MFSRVCGKVRYKFNTKAFLVDEAGANFARIKEEFGEEVALQRVLQCQSHLKIQLNRK